LQRKAAAREEKSDLSLVSPSAPRCCTSRQNPPPAPEFDYAGNCIRLVGGKLAFGHGPGHSPERIGNIGGCLDRRKVKFNRTPFANRDKPLDAKAHRSWIAAFRRSDHGFHDVVGIILHDFFT
jgi:hypothetical protein